MQCITTASYSLSLNGEMFGYFLGKRGLRQGDPLSPLIFTLCMKYLTRSLKYAAAKYDFGYHPMCKQLKLINLMFADDVLIFSRGDASSMILLLKSYSTFSNALGLKVSAHKSNAYFSGVPDALKQDILRVSGFSEGKLPFRYLGMAIHTTGPRKNDLLSSLCSYWASLFILPKGIINRVEATCQNFLWDGSAEYRRSPLVAWDKICRPKDKEGLGLKDQETWNKAMVGRLVDSVFEKKYTIWVHWVTAKYLRGQSWLGYKPSSNSSWVWRRICKVKQEIVAGYTDGHWHIQNEGYTPSNCYKWLRGPNRRNLVQLLNQCTGSSIPVTDVMESCVQLPGSKLQRGVQIALVMGVVYHVWQQRNMSRMEIVLLRPEWIAALILKDMRARIKGMDKMAMKLDDIEWLERKHLM
ncbi:uncharacterized protein LOC141589926 [Silene latifolia]|uniref:uncharacterized protein LOC141589926 n=1 Tax=Silene latifolia TaxID=37657 RepID=UPI003D7855C1